MDFEDFVLLVLAKEGTSFDPHLEPQEKFSKPIYQIGFDAIIRIEDLDKSWPEIAKTIGAPQKELLKENSTVESKDFHRISCGSRRVIVDLYCDDFKELGFEKLTE
jgi:hypothetical protein